MSVDTVIRKLTNCLLSRTPFNKLEPFPQPVNLSSAVRILFRASRKLTTWSDIHLIQRAMLVTALSHVAIDAGVIPLSPIVEDRKHDTCWIISDEELCKLPLGD